MVGVSIGAGEWLFGPAVTAQYGGTLLWLGGLSILMQLFYNLEVMRYTLYCGEPVHVGSAVPGPVDVSGFPSTAVLSFPVSGLHGLQRAVPLRPPCWAICPAPE